MVDEIYQGLTVIPSLPDPNMVREADPLFERLVGATILRIGAPSESSLLNGEVGLEGGGLVIDYLLPNDPTPYRAILAFNENGMWVMYESYSGAQMPRGD